MLPVEPRVETMTSRLDFHQVPLMVTMMGSIVMHLRRHLRLLLMQR